MAPPRSLGLGCSAVKALSELRRLSGLTWEQLAKLFNVSRRSLHFWDSGQPLSHFNEEHLNRLLGTIRYVDQGSASLNRSLLLRPDGNGNPLLDLLIAGKYEEFKKVVGAGNAPQKVELGALSEEERRMRMPLPPDVLANPLSDVSYRQTGKTKPARVARSRINLHCAYLIGSGEISASQGVFTAAQSR